MSRTTATCSALATVLLVAFSAFYVATQGFRAVTSDAGRQAAFARSPRLVPDIRLVDSRQQVSSFTTLVQANTFTVVALIYTQCTSLCLLTASSEAYLQEKLRRAGLHQDVKLLTISFDPARDTPDVLAQYARRVKADPSHWTIATTADARDLDLLLSTFGVIVIAEANGEYRHNGALFLVDRNGQIFEALGPDAADATMRRLAQLVGP